MTKPGPLSLIDHEIAHEKTVVFVRHGMTTWNEQKRIQVEPARSWMHDCVTGICQACMHSDCEACHHLLTVSSQYTETISL